MTEYSFPLHADPEEAPAELPQVEEIRKDILEMKEWYKQFQERQKEQ